MFESDLFGTQSKSYVALARKWRPAQFSDLVGQNAVTLTLSNAIRFNRLHHCYLLTGSRGIGKTSIARIFSKAIRCDHKQTENLPYVSSCDQCSSCIEIASSSSVDVIEIDGASNNGVDAVREIRDNTQFMPSSGSKKIFIIDEVHMLTTSAFNALLKTLEEPPAHVLFILATTEPHKIPGTILSRCQRFDLKRVSISEIEKRLQEITLNESITAPSEALRLIARSAEGSIRDALSLLDQVIAYSGSEVTLKSVRESVGLIENQVIIELTRAVFTHQTTQALDIVQNLYNSGHDLKLLSRHFIECLHAILLAQSSPQNLQRLEYSDDEIQEIQGLASLRPTVEIELIFQALHQSLEWMSKSPQPKIVFDVVIMKCCHRSGLARAQYSAPLPAAQTPSSIGSGSQSSPSFSPGSSLAKHQATGAASGSLNELSNHTTPSVTTPRLTLHKSGPAIRGSAAQSQITNNSQESSPSVALNHTNVIQKTAKNWEEFIDCVREVRPLLASVLEHATCPNFEESGILQIQYAENDQYFLQQCKTKPYQDQIIIFLKQFAPHKNRIQIDENKDLNSVESLANRRAREKQESEENIRRMALNHPIITEARSLFGGELGPIEVIGMEKNLH